MILKVNIDLRGQLQYPSIKGGGDGYRYASKSLEKSLKDQRAITRNYGKIAKNLIHRLSDLRVANDLSQITHLPPPRRHKLTGNFEGCWGIDLSKNMRLVIRPVGEFDPDDLTTITSVCIVDIQDYH